MEAWKCRYTEAWKHGNSNNLLWRTHKSGPGSNPGDDTDMSNDEPPLYRLTISIAMRESKIWASGPGQIFDSDRMVYLI